MDLRQLRHLVGVAEARSFTVAAVRLGISQPALSQSIARLERELDCTLFVRNKQNPGTGLLLTPAGATLVADARGILDAVDRAESRARRAGHAVDTVRVAIGFASSTPRALTRAALAIPGVEVFPVQVEWGDDHASLVSGRVDLAFLQYPVGWAAAEYAVVGLARAPRVAVFPGGHRLAGRASVTVDDIAGEPILDPGVGVDRGFWLGEPRAGLVVVGPAVRTVEEMCAFVAAGRGMAITSGFVADQYRQPGVGFVPIEGLGPVEVGLVRLREDVRAEVVGVFEELAGLSVL
ncbi:LysR family transcriptional regulator [Cryptosporangium phraense]|uniref:LysR family transcriptional regulator n=1 Tax=Cryptosporangium phraense TaxID=2593070 RepID=A0A545ADV3_9ACTN|nr:LysR family transcriptional regulator [Cryptosporangium phraense]TQS39516.1 LysR family transcriptional regulator [Cryptosporangium phraense]